MTRRDLLRAAPLAALPRFAFAQDTTPPSGMIVRMREPQNLETPAAGLGPWKTPTEQFFVRSHFAVPKIEMPYSLSVSGHVEKPLKLSLAELTALASVTKPLTLECAGN